MREAEFREFLSDFPYTKEQVAACVEGVGLFEEHLASAAEFRTTEDVRSAEIPGFIEYLGRVGKRERQPIVGLYLYAGFIGNQDLELGLLELLDGFEILGNLYRAVGEELGAQIQAEVFAGVELPEIGSTPFDWTRANSVVFPRLEAVADRSTVTRILRSGLRNLPDAGYLPVKERYEELADIDTFLDERGERHYARLEEHRNAGTPYFNQMIDDNVLAFVRDHPEIGRGVRQGNTVIETKIPHQAIEYLATDDLPTKQYRVCHCPLVKESMAPGGPEVSATFCEFCPSFNAKPWEVIFGRKLEYDVLESAKRGGVWCRFAIHLPDETVATASG